MFDRFKDFEQFVKVARALGYEVKLFTYSAQPEGKPFRLDVVRNAGQMSTSHGLWAESLADALKDFDLPPDMAAYVGSVPPAVLGDDK